MLIFGFGWCLLVWQDLLVENCILRYFQTFLNTSKFFKTVLFHLKFKMEQSYLSYSLMQGVLNMRLLLLLVLKVIQCPKTVSLEKSMKILLIVRICFFLFFVFYCKKSHKKNHTSCLPISIDISDIPHPTPKTIIKIT